MDRPSPPGRTDGRPPTQDDATRSKWSSTESLPFAIAPNAGSGSFSGRQGRQGEGVSASPIPGRRYSNLGSNAEPSSRASPNLNSGIGLGINSRSPSGNYNASGTSYERPSSLHRTSYLSQSGRSFTHITAAGGASPGYSGEQSRPRLQSLLSSPAMGATGSGVSASPGTPPLLGYLGRASTSFSPSTSHSRPSSLGRGLPTNLHGTAAGSPTPPIPETHESGDDNEGAIGPSTSIASSRNIRRYSSSFGQQQQPHQRRATSWLGAGSTTSSGEPGSLVFGASSRGDGSAGESRRTSGRGSMDGFGMRRSSVTSLSRGHAAPTQAEKDAINDFLRTLDTLAQEPGSAVWDPAESQPGSQGRTGTETTPDPPLGSSTSSAALRKPLTKSQMDEALKRMAGSYTPPFPPPSAGTSPRIPIMRPTVSPPVALERPIVTSPQAILQRHSSSVKSSSPLAGEPIRANRVRSTLDTPASQSESTSASAASSVHEQVVEPLTFGKTRSTMHPEKPCEESSDGGARGESTDREKRRGTVLLRGGFGQFAQSSPTTREHSPLATTGGASSPVGPTKLLQSPRRHTEREVPRFRHESDRPSRPLGPASDRAIAPILSAGAQPLDQGVRSWTSRRPLGSDGDEGQQTTGHAMYTAPSSLESRRQQRTGGWMAADEEYGALPTFGDAGRLVRRAPLSTRPSDDGDDSIVGNLEMSGAQD